MDVEVNAAINMINYYYDEYQKGSEEALIALEGFLDGLNSTIKTALKYYYIYQLILVIQRLKVMIANIKVLNDEYYVELMNMCKTDLKLYINSAKILKKYIKKSKKDMTYYNITNAYIFSIKMSSILININLYCEEINRILQYSKSTITYIPQNQFLKLRELDNKNELSLLRKTIEKKSLD